MRHGTSRGRSGGGGRRTRLHTAISQQSVAADGLAGVVALGEGGGSRSTAQLLHDRCGILTVAADDRDVEHGHLGLRWVTPGLQAVLAEDGKLAVQNADVRGKVAAIAEPGGDRQRSFAAAAADDDRDPRQRPRAAGGFGQPDPLAAVLRGAGLPQGAQRLDGRLELVEPGLGRRKWQARTLRARAPTSRPRCRRTIVRRSVRQAWPQSWPRSRARGTSRVSPACPAGQHSNVSSAEPRQAVPPIQYRRASRLGSGRASGFESEIWRVGVALNRTARGWR